MKICILSDLHLEKTKIKLVPINCDIMILAGDIGTGTLAKDFIIWHLDNGVKHILYVLGNHEFWNDTQINITSFFSPKLSSLRQESIYPQNIDSYNFTLKEWLDLDDKIERLHVLHNKEFIYENVKFLGTTLWTDFDRNVENEKLAENMNDYKYITYNNEKLKPHDTFNFHIKAIKWLKENLEIKKNEMKTIVISHHLPSYSCVHKKYGKSYINSCYASNLDELIKQYQIDYWIHGHTHTSVCIELHNTKIICNPRGYIKRNMFEENILENPHFTYKNILEI